MCDAEWMSDIDKKYDKNNRNCTPKSHKQKI